MKNSLISYNEEQEVLRSDKAFMNPDFFNN